uniref:Uncharacterized protein n=1 Tax=Arundo donax TaxID=35708 RepID=A0A0A9APX0_ARUDO
MTAADPQHMGTPKLPINQSGNRWPGWSRRQVLADLLAEALALDAVEPTLAPGEALRPADVLTVALAHTASHEPVALRDTVPCLRHPRRPHL